MKRILLGAVILALTAVPAMGQQYLEKTTATIVGGTEGYNSATWDRLHAGTHDMSTFYYKFTPETGNWFERVVITPKTVGHYYLRVRVWASSTDSTTILESASDDKDYLLWETGGYGTHSTTAVQPPVDPKELVLPFHCYAVSIADTVNEGAATYDLLIVGYQKPN